MGYRDKIKSRAEVILIAANHANQGKQIVFTNGCFDLIHPGHISLLEKAKTLGDILIVALNSDESVRLLKGENRPYNKQDFRAKILAAFASVDYVTIFNEETPEELIKLLVPDVLVKGGDYDKSEIVGADFVERNEGRVAIIPFEEGHSSTKIIQKIKNK